MNTKLSPTGSGPLIAAVSLPYALVAIWLDHRYPAFFSLNDIPVDVARYLAILLAMIGAALYISTVRYLLRALKTTVLMTGGPFALSRNPMYAAFGCFIIPSIAVAMRSWLVLTTCLVFYIVFRLSIGREVKEMTELFGGDYRRYCERTSEFFPWWPKK